jgi:hypothetical protein
MRQLNIMASFSDLFGQTLSSVEGKVGGEDITFTLSDGRKCRLYHSQDCCETVTVEDICGNLEDLVGSPILQAEESSNNSLDPKAEASRGSFTWTFYRMATIKGSVVIRWFGESKGHYSESVDFVQYSESVDFIKDETRLNA